mmetsp:Transcript_34270/g.28918  ORF Transcript_34270/g.28918 Transcript_34270/m.28918 type:complete len:297 (+) Transcript_34270:260-1150(+)
MSKNQFESMRNTFERREQDLIDQYESRIQGLVTTIDNLKYNIQTAIDNVSGSNNSSGGFTLEDINTIKKTTKMEYDSRIEALIEKQKEENTHHQNELLKMGAVNIEFKKNEMLQSDEISRLQKSIDQSHNSTQSNENKLMERVKELNVQLVSKDQTNLKLSNDMTNVQKNLSEYSQLNIELEQTIEDYKNRTESVTKGSSELQGMLLEKDAQIKKFMNEVKAVKEEKKKVDVNLGQREGENLVLQEKIANLDLEVNNYKNSLESTDEQLNETIDEYKTTIEILKDQIQDQTKNQQT